MHILFITLLIMFAPFMNAVEESEQINIRLATDNQSMPLYLSKFINENSGLGSEYLQKLEQILTFDLNHNGMTYTLSQTTENEKLVSRLSSGTVSAKEWKPVSIYYVVKVVARTDKKLSTTLLSVSGNAANSIDGITLTGDLNRDRRQVHQLADAIYKALFDENGIATTRILYSVKPRGETPKDKWVADIWESDYDGGNARPVIRDGSYNISPVYIPPKAGFSSGSFFYVSYKSAQPKIFFATLKEGVGRRMSYLRGNQLMPSISRQRNQIAFVCDVTGNPDLFLQNFSPDEGVKDKPRQIFAAHKATQGSPTFSPDGKRIAFVTNKDGSPRVYVMDVPALGTPLKDIKAQLVTKHSRESTAPTWSPDGTKLAYCALTSGVRQIWVYDFTTKEERQLTKGPGNKENPSWAPNSMCLVYNCSDTGACELFLTTINQGISTKISTNAGEKRFPNWEARAG